MDEISKHPTDQSYTHDGDVRVRRNCETANYGNQIAYAGNHSPLFGSNLPTAINCYDSQISGIARRNSLYGADYRGNGTAYRGKVKTHENNDRSGRITHMLERNYYENNPSIEINGNNGSRYGHNSISYEHNHTPSTNFRGLLASGSAAYYDETKSYTTSVNSNQAVINGHKQAPVDTARYSGNQNVSLYDVQNTHGIYNVPTYTYQGVNWTSPGDANHHGTQRHYYSDTTSATRTNNYSNETLPYGSGRSSSHNLQFDGSAYGQHHEPQKETNDKHRTTWSYQQQASKVDDVTSRKRKLDGEKRGSTSKQEINNNDVTTSTPKVDKRALYSKFRVVKRKDQSQVFNESTKIKPFLLRFKLGDKTIVDVNDQDGLPRNTKRAKIVPTVTPIKENEAEATIGNIEFITLDNMKIVRRKLEVVQLVQQEDERQERLKAEAEVKAKVKANAKARLRTDKKRKDRRRGHV
ncbi:uncharacterized protein LOC110464948 [Mizuhopecten yessoensis]|uniref:Uncharacterized protein n=1 Tax=Mizuhopecten yessoensis TaxID=6573 RepID=A0A210PST7_MIZYE|nr:uncharacterized protein LOC110464948 [Mizuhopecten yessoensis]OWF39524.1 hypothetical protein KP79_PYT11109 [Mizuhopecten yessoensis]